VVPQKYRYSKAPEAINTEFNIRQKTKNGIFKLYAYANYNEVGLLKPSLDYISSDEQFRLRNQHVFTNATYSTRLGNDWQLFTGADQQACTIKIDAHEKFCRAYKVVHRNGISEYP
jgi:hypothetical protein